MRIGYKDRLAQTRPPSGDVPSIQKTQAFRVHGPVNYETGVSQSNKTSLSADRSTRGHERCPRTAAEWCCTELHAWQWPHELLGAIDMVCEEHDEGKNVHDIYDNARLLQGDRPETGSTSPGSFKLCGQSVIKG